MATAACWQSRSSRTGVTAIGAKTGGCPSCRLPFACDRRLEIVQIGDSALRMCGGLEDRALIIYENAKPGIEVGGVVRPRLELRRDAEVGAEEAAPQFAISSSRARSLLSFP